MSDRRYGRVGYLDTDVGQPDFSPPGCVSLTLIQETIPGIDILHPTSFFFYIMEFLSN